MFICWKVVGAIRDKEIFICFLRLVFISVYFIKGKSIHITLFIYLLVLDY